MSRKVYRYECGCTKGFYQEPPVFCEDHQSPLIGLASLTTSNGAMTAAAPPPKTVAVTAHTRKKMHGIADDVREVAADLSPPFTFAQLLIACWQRYPGRFALDGALEHPDARKLATALYGRRGVIERGVIRRVPGRDGWFEAVQTFKGVTTPCP